MHHGDLQAFWLSSFSQLENHAAECFTSCVLSSKSSRVTQRKGPSREREREHINLRNTKLSVPTRSWAAELKSLWSTDNIPDTA